MTQTSRKLFILYVLLFLLLGILFIANILFGSINIPIQYAWKLIWETDPTLEKWQVIIQNSRIPQTVTALLTGMSLAVCGLLLQTLFKNPLASPSIMGITSGAGLGVAFVTLFTGSISAFGFYGYMAVISGALLGAMGVLGIILLCSQWIKNNVMLLIIGIMISYLANSIISLLSFYASAEGIVSYVMWGMGDFSTVNKESMPYFIGFSLFGLTASIFMIKPLNALALGERYAQNLGVRITQARFTLLLTTGLLTAITTAFCGPISFIGLAVPHISRLLNRSSNHVVLIPTTILLGGIITLICNLCTVIFTSGTIIPINVITPLIGAPIILYVIINQKKIAYFS